MSSMILLMSRLPGGHSIHFCGPATGKARLPTVQSSERSDRRLGRVGDTCKRAVVPWRTTISKFYDKSHYHRHRACTGQL